MRQINDKMFDTVNKYIAKTQGIEMNEMIENGKKTPKEIKEIVKEIKRIMGYNRTWKYRGYKNVNPKENIYTILITKYFAKRNIVAVRKFYYYPQNQIGWRLRMFEYYNMTDYMNSEEMGSPFIG